MRNKCLFALGLVFAMSLTSIVAFAFSFTGEPDVKNDQQQIVVVNPATESEETTSEQTVSAETEDTTATLQSAGSSLSGSMDWDAEDAYMLAKIAMAESYYGMQSWMPLLLCKNYDSQIQRRRKAQ